MSVPPAIVLLGPRGHDIGRRLVGALPGARLHAPSTRPLAAADIAYEHLGAHLRRLYRDGAPIVAVAASGIVIRALAPLLADKASEPPVLAVAEDGSVVVPLLGGHQGANRLARLAAETLGCQAAITTAGDLRFGLALDEPPPGWTVRNPEAAKGITAALLEGEPVALRLETGAADWLTEGGAPFVQAAQLMVAVTDRDDGGSASRLVLHPQVLAVGVGCERDTDPEELTLLAEGVLAGAGLARQAVACIASLDLKAAEPAVHALAERWQVPARFFAAGALEAERPRLANPSEQVFRATGCHGVAEGAALAAAGAAGELVVAKTRSSRATVALARAQAPIDPGRIGRPRGQLTLVGLGPGARGWRTPEASARLEAADDIVGYWGYLDLIEPAATAAARHGFELGDEVARARLALDLAAEGRRVALVCSGDAGIYAMASLVYELLERAGDERWARVAVEVAPGLSALQAAAARAGAPLGHDFCAISLSDLLTPWAEIERRLRAACAGDFATVLYNPASTRRRQGLSRALQLLGEALPPATPVIHARNLGRAGEWVEIGRLDGFDPGTVDMLSLIIVGCSRTRWVTPLRGRPFVYTPRGYVVDQRSVP